jgi:hypothetical protein
MNYTIALFTLLVLASWLAESEVKKGQPKRRRP